MSADEGVSISPGKQDADNSLSGIAKSGVISLTGALTSAIMGFGLILVLGRTLGENQSGIVLQAIAVFSIALAVARMGLDTTGVWLLPRIAVSSPRVIRPAVISMLIPAAVFGSLGAFVLWFGAPIFASAEPGADELVAAVRNIAWFLPAGSVMMVGLQITRGLGDIIPFAVIGNIAVPTARPALAILAVAFGGTAVAVATSWTLPLAFGAVLTLWVVARRVNAALHQTTDTVYDSATRKVLQKRIWRFAVPRWYASILEQSITWFDVVIVGFITGASAAGIYGAASRFVTAGLIISTAMRIVVSPRFSSLLEQRRTSDVQTLYTTTVTWVVLFGTPIFVVFICFPETILGWLGEGFESGATVLVMLSAATLISMMFGNADSLLMMSGRSGLLALNKSIVLIVNVVGNILLVPLLGIEGAAIIWSASILLNCILAASQNAKFLGIGWGGRKVLYSLLVALICSATPCFVVVLLLGKTTVALIVSVALLLTILAIWCFMDRKRLGLSELVALRRSRRAN